MYSRNYYNQKKDIILPDKYDGTALSENIEKTDIFEEAPTVADEAREQGGEIPTGLFDKKGTMIEQNKENTDKNADFSALFSALPLKHLFGGSLFDKLKMPSFEAEDLLIIGIALYFFFSKSGDKLLAVMLIAILFT